jgi:transcriptional regulator
MPPDYVQQQMKAVIAFEIEITGTRHVFKLSQNRDETSRENIIENLSSSESAEANKIAEEMKRHYGHHHNE